MTEGSARRSCPAFLAACVLITTAAPCSAATTPLAPFGIPIEFILFGITLAGVAMFHHHTLRVALVGLGIIVSYQLLFTGFKTGPGIKGLIDHLGHEWVTLTNLLLLLVGFALLVAPLRKEPRPDHAASLPAGRLERRLRPAGDDLRTFVLPRQHRSGTDRRRDGASAVSRQGAHRVSRRHRRGIECRWRRQRHRRYHDHHDVDPWRVAAQRARGLHWSCVPRW